LFSAFGFGGIPGDFSSQYRDCAEEKKANLRHCFNLTGVKGKSTVQFVDKLLAVYRNAAKDTTLWGPTFFGPVLTQQRNFI
jgi:hypothetical protein